MIPKSSHYLEGNTLLRAAVNNIIFKIKGEQYRLDENISERDIVGVLVTKLIDCIRGFFKTIGFKNKPRICFVGHGVKFRHKNHISAGTGLCVGSYASINGLAKQGIILGNNVTIGSRSIIDCTGVIRSLGEGLVIGDNVGISDGAHISARGKIEIENDCIIGPDVCLESENHVYIHPSIPIRLQGESRRGIKLCRGCWIGRGATVLDGVTIGSNSVIGAGAVVTKDIPDHCVAVGVPARVIKQIGR